MLFHNILTLSFFLFLFQVFGIITSLEAYNTQHGTDITQIIMINLIMNETNNMLDKKGIWLNNNNMDNNNN